jgi:hypothetical protein
MDSSLDSWLRGDNHATTGVIQSAGREPRAGTDADVIASLADMLRAIERAKNPAADQNRPVSLRGFSWIVNPFESGGVVIALELSLGAVVAGPFDIAEQDLTTRIQRVINAERAALSQPGGATIH